MKIPKSWRQDQYQAKFTSKYGPVECLQERCLSFNYIIWLSLIRVTDWLNTVMWLKHNSVCSPPQSCGGGTLIDTTNCFYSGKLFTQKNGIMSLRYYRLNKMYVARPWQRAGCLLRMHAHSAIDTHCTARKKTPAELCDFYDFYEYFMPGALWTQVSKMSQFALNKRIIK